MRSMWRHHKDRRKEALKVVGANNTVTQFPSNENSRLRPTRDNRPFDVSSRHSGHSQTPSATPTSSRFLENERRRVARVVTRTSGNPDFITVNARQIPPRVRVCVTVSCLDHVLKNVIETNVFWNKEHWPREVERSVMQSLAQSQKLALREGMQLDLISGNCVAFDEVENREIKAERLTDDEDWCSALQKVVTGAHMGHDSPPRFHVLITLQYAPRKIESVDGEKYHTTLQNVMSERKIKNWDGLRYLPDPDIKQIFSRATINVLIKEEPFFRSFTDVEKRVFKELAAGEAMRLLAAGLSADLPMSCIYHMIVKSKVRDVQMPKQQFQDECGDSLAHRGKFSDFISYQTWFKAHVFIESPLKPPNYEFDFETVLPWTNDNDKVLGEGGFSVVYQVQLHPGHHHFPHVSYADSCTENFADFASEPQTRLRCQGFQGIGQRGSGKLRKRKEGSERDCCKSTRPPCASSCVVDLSEELLHPFSTCRFEPEKTVQRTIAGTQLRLCALVAPPTAWSCGWATKSAQFWKVQVRTL